MNSAFRSSATFSHMGMAADRSLDGEQIDAQYPVQTVQMLRNVGGAVVDRRQRDLQHALSHGGASVSAELDELGDMVELWGSAEGVAAPYLRPHVVTVDRVDLQQNHLVGSSAVEPERRFGTEIIPRLAVPDLQHEGQLLKQRVSFSDAYRGAI